METVSKVWVKSFRKSCIVKGLFALQVLFEKFFYLSKLVSFYSFYLNFFFLFSFIFLSSTNSYKYSISGAFLITKDHTTSFWDASFLFFFLLGPQMLSE